MHVTCSLTSVIQHWFRGSSDVWHGVPHVQLSQGQVVHEIRQLQGKRTKIIFYKSLECILFFLFFIYWFIKTPILLQILR